MAATFVVEDGTGLATANSYASVAEGDQYHDNFGASTTWTGAVQADKEHALREGTAYLDRTYHTRWIGRREDDRTNNGTDWPRVGAIDVDGFTIDSDSVPNRIKEATIVLALKVLAGDTLTPDQTSPGQIKRRKRKVDVIETEDEYVGGRSQVKWYREVGQLVSGFIDSASTMQRS